MSNDMNGEAMREIEGSIVTLNLVIGVMDGCMADNGYTGEQRQLLASLNGLLANAKMRLEGVHKGRVAANTGSARAIPDMDQPQDAVLIEDGFTGGYILTCPQGRIAVSQYRVGPRVLPGHVDGLDQFAVAETARAIAKGKGWSLVDHTAAGILNIWLDVGGKEGAA